MANGHGGARKNAGRKAKNVKFETEINAAEQRNFDRLPTTLENLEQLADGGLEQVEEEWVPAGTVVIDDVVEGEEGKTMRIKRRAFPDTPANELVLVKRKVTTLAPDKQVNMYLTDRALGKPTQKIEGEIDFEGLDVTEQARTAAAQELAEWRKQQTEQLSNLPNVLPMPPMPATPTE